MLIFLTSSKNVVYVHFYSILTIFGYRKFEEKYKRNKIERKARGKKKIKLKIDLQSINGLCH